MKRVAVVGGGIAGLTAALDLHEGAASAGLDLACTVVEADRRFGGKIATSRVDGLVIEAGADSFLSAKPAALALCARLGLSDHLINTKDDRRTYVYSKGRLRPLPEGLVLGSPARAGALLRSGLLSPAGAARMALDVAVPARRDNADESLASFFTRRLGREAFERVVEPLVAGIHAGDAHRLSLRATFPRFAEMERDHGGLVRATLAARRRGDDGAAQPSDRTPFVSLHNGLGELTEALTARLAALGVTLVPGARVTALRSIPDRLSSGYQVVADGVADVEFDAVVLATPAYRTARLVGHLCPTAAGLLESIPHVSTATVSIAYRVADLGREPRGFGFVVPRVEGRQLIAATWSSSKWPGRAPPGVALVRGYLGGAGREEVLREDDDALVRLVRDELGTLAGIRGNPVHAEVHRYPRGMPQYTPGHLERVAKIRSELTGWPGIAVTGAAYGGVGIPDCILDATTTAAAVLAELRSDRTR